MELLIKAADPKKNEIIYHQQDGAVWGQKECLESFIVVRVAVETKEELYGVDPETGALLEFNESGEKIKKFDLDAAFTEEELSIIRNSNWKVVEKSMSFIVDK